MSVALKDRRLDSLTQHLTGTASSGDEPGTISGTAVKYNVDVERGYGLFMRLLPGCFADQVRHAARVKILWQHDTDEPIGKLSRLRDTSTELGFMGKIQESEFLPTANKALELLRTEVLDEVSIGFRIQKFTREIDEEKDVVTYVVSKGHLREVSASRSVRWDRQLPTPGRSVASRDQFVFQTVARVREARRIATEFARLRA